jgi:hypothetical protein
VQCDIFTFENQPARRQVVVDPLAGGTHR